MAVTSDIVYKPFFNYTDNPVVNLVKRNFLDSTLLDLIEKIDKFYPKILGSSFVTWLDRGKEFEFCGTIKVVLVPYPEERLKSVVETSFILLAKVDKNFNIDDCKQLQLYLENKKGEKTKLDFIKEIKSYKSDCVYKEAKHTVLAINIIFERSVLELTQQLLLIYDPVTKKTLTSFAILPIEFKEDLPDRLYPCDLKNSDEIEACREYLHGLPDKKKFEDQIDNPKPRTTVSNNLKLLLFPCSTSYTTSQLEKLDPLYKLRGKSVTKLFFANSNNNNNSDVASKAPKKKLRNVAIQKKRTKNINLIQINNLIKEMTASELDELIELANREKYGRKVLINSDDNKNKRNKVNKGKMEESESESSNNESYERSSDSDKIEYASKEKYDGEDSSASDDNIYKTNNGKSEESESESESSSSSNDTSSKYSSYSSD
ncbi:MAG: hypothetical protein Tsb0021_10690 [Chlamydiales bacterium]